MRSFEFMTAPRIIFGCGCLKSGLKEARDFGKKALLIHAQSGAPLKNVTGLLDSEKIDWESYAVGHEPSVDLIQDVVTFAKKSGCDFVIAFGGGSVQDTGKATSAMLTNPGDILDYLEVVGKNQPLIFRTAPCVAIPTTAGTGAEVTRNAVLAVPEKKVKVSLRSNFLIPDLAIIDPELTFSLPPSVTAYTGLDALTQVIEPYVSPKSNPMMDVICCDGITRSARSLKKAVKNGQDSEAREDLSFTSLYGGLALTNAGLGAVHGFAAPMGGMFDIPHGAVCGILLPEVVRVNITVMRQRDQVNPALKRYKEVSQILTGKDNATLEDGINWLEDLVKDLNIPRLSSYGITSSDFPVIVEKAQKASSMKANPIVLTSAELITILEAAY